MKRRATDKELTPTRQSGRLQNKVAEETQLAENRAAQIKEPQLEVTAGQFTLCTKKEFEDSVNITNNAANDGNARYQKETVTLNPLKEDAKEKGITLDDRYTVISLVNSVGEVVPNAQRVGILYFRVGSNVERNHLCNHSSGKQVLWHLKLESIFGLDLHLFPFEFHLLVAKYENTNEKTDAEAEKWFYVGEASFRGCTSGRVRGGGAFDRPQHDPHYSMYNFLTFPRLYKPELTTLAKIGIQPLSCKMNKYGASLCDPCNGEAF